MKTDFTSLQELLLELREETSPRLETEGWAREAGVTETYLNRLLRADELPGWEPGEVGVEGVLLALFNRLPDRRVWVEGDQCDLHAGGMVLASVLKSIARKPANPYAAAAEAMAVAASLGETDMLFEDPYGAACPTLVADINKE